LGLGDGYGFDNMQRFGSFFGVNPAFDFVHFDLEN